MRDEIDLALDLMLEAQVITFADYEVCRQLKKLSGSNIIGLVGLLINKSLKKGDTFVFINEISGKSLTELLISEDSVNNFKFTSKIKSEIESIILPNETILASEIDTFITKFPGIFKIFSYGRIFFDRIYNYERTVSEILKKIASLNIAAISISINPYFEKNNTLSDINLKNLTEEQKKAVEISGLKKLVIISGGPGTGKTTAVKSIIEKMANENGEIKIALAAPTGKAVSRLAFSLDGASNNHIAVKPVTLHRLLGFNSFGTQAKYSDKNKLPYNFIIIDEFSMVSLEMAYKLFTAVPDDAGLVLIGDKDQLASVEMGAVMREICSNDNNNPLASCLVELNENFRFSDKSGIGNLAKNIKNYSKIKNFNIEDILKEHFDDLSVVEIEGKEIKLREINNKGVSDIENVINEITECYLESIELLKGFSGDNSDKLNSLEKALSFVKVLTPYNDGVFGAEYLNLIIDANLRKKVLSNAALHNAVNKNSTEWYFGRQIIIGTNDYQEGLYNGDIGIYADVNGNADINGNGKVFFPIAGSSNVIYELTQARSFDPSILPSHNLAFALTVHKSQGSEFDNVYFFIGNKESDLLSRELIYTAVTRARKKLTIIGNARLFNESVKKSFNRKSIIAELLSTVCP